MTKPFVNLDSLEVIYHEHGKFKASYAPISEAIGAKKLGYNLTVVPPGGRVCPYHNHRINEEMFLILEGEGTLRFGPESYKVKKHDIIACPPGNRDVAHQLINSSDCDLKFLAVSTAEPGEICEYPDSNKVGVYVGKSMKRDFREIFKIDQSVDYFEGED